MDICTDLLKALKGEHLSPVFSPDGTLTSASAAPHCGVLIRPISGETNVEYLETVFSVLMRPLFC